MTYDLKQYEDIRSLIIYCKDTLPLSTTFNKNDQDELLFNFHTVCFSKYAHLLKHNIGSEPVKSNGILVISPICQDGAIKVLNPDKSELFMYTLNPNDLLLFPDFIEYIEYPKGAFLKYIFPVTDKLNFGFGNKQFEVSITFSDTYKIIVNAENEEDAINQADLLGIGKFEHIWPENKNNEYDRTNQIRSSMWNKKMYKAKEI